MAEELFAQETTQEGITIERAFTGRVSESAGTTQILGERLAPGEYGAVPYQSAGFSRQLRDIYYRSPGGGLVFVGREEQARGDFQRETQRRTEVELLRDVEAQRAETERRDLAFAEKQRTQEPSGGKPLEVVAYTREGIPFTPAPSGGYSSVSGENVYTFRRGFVASVDPFLSSGLRRVPFSSASGFPVFQTSSGERLLQISNPVPGTSGQTFLSERAFSENMRQDAVLEQRQRDYEEATKFARESQKGFEFVADVAEKQPSVLTVPLEAGAFVARQVGQKKLAFKLEEAAGGVKRAPFELLGGFAYGGASVADLPKSISYGQKYGDYGPALTPVLTYGGAVLASVGPVASFVFKHPFVAGAVLSAPKTLDAYGSLQAGDVKGFISNIGQAGLLFALPKASQVFAEQRAVSARAQFLKEAGESRTVADSSGVVRYVGEFDKARVFELRGSLTVSKTLPGNQELTVTSQARGFAFQLNEGAVGVQKSAYTATVTRQPGIVENLSSLLSGRGLAKPVVVKTFKGAGAARQYSFPGPEVAVEGGNVPSQVGFGRGAMRSFTQKTTESFTFTTSGLTDARIAFKEVLKPGVRPSQAPGFEAFSVGFREGRPTFLKTNPLSFQAGDLRFFTESTRLTGRVGSVMRPLGKTIIPEGRVFELKPGTGIQGSFKSGRGVLSGSGVSFLQTQTLKPLAQPRVDLGGVFASVEKQIAGQIKPSGGGAGFSLGAGMAAQQRVAKTEEKMQRKGILQVDPVTFQKEQRELTRSASALSARSGQRPEQKQKRAMGTVSRVSVGIGFRQETGTKTVPFELASPKEAFSEAPILRDLDQVVPRQAVGELPDFSFKQKTLPKVKVPGPFFPGIPRSEFVKIITPNFPAFSDFAGFPGKKSGLFRPGRRSFRYQPDVTSLVLGIRGKRPRKKVFSGFELRPL